MLRVVVLLKNGELEAVECQDQDLFLVVLRWLLIESDSAAMPFQANRRIMCGSIRDHKIANRRASVATPIEKRVARAGLAFARKLCKPIQAQALATARQAIAVIQN